MQIRELASGMDLGSKSSRAWQALAALSLGILLGAASLALGPALVLMGLTGVLVVYLALVTPEIIVLVLLAFVLELIPPQYNLSVSLFVGHFFVTDLLLAMLLSIVLVRLLADKTFRLVKTPLDTPMLLFCGAAVVGMATAIRSHGIRFSHATPEARVYIYYLIFFVVTNLIRTRSQLARLIHGILVIAVLVAGTMVMQAMAGRSLIIMQAWQVQGEELVRLFNPGFVLCYIALMTLICGMALRQDHRSRWIHYLLILLLGLGLVTTVTRNVLVSLTIALAVLAVILRKSGLSRLATNLWVVAGIALFGIAMLTLLGGEKRLLEYFSGFFERTSSMFSSTILSSQENVLIRWNEIEYAWQQIVTHPIFGIGFQTAYRPVFARFELVSLTHYLHNAYLSMWLKTGLLGPIAFLWLSWRFLSRGLRHWGEAQDSFFSAVTLGFTLAYLGLMISNLVAPTFVQDRSAMIFGVMMGINEVAFVQSEANVKLNQGGSYNVQS
jgi:O-antigen ligase